MNKNIRNCIGLLIAAIFVAQIFAMPVYGMEIEKSVDMTDAMPGEDIAYTIRVNFTENASDVTIVDHLPDGLVYINDSQNGTLEGKNITWNLGDVNESIVQILLNVSIAETYNGTAVVNNSVNLSYEVNGSTCALSARSQEVGIKASAREDIKINFTTIFSGGTHHQLMMEAMKDYPNINYTTYRTTKLPKDLNLSTQDLILLDLSIETLVPEIEQTVKDAIEKNNATVIVVSPLMPTVLNLSNVNHSEHPYIMEYFDNSGLENHRRLLTYIMVKFFGLTATIEEPISIPKVGIYHPDSVKPFANVTEYLAWYGNDTGTHHLYDPGKPTVGILFSSGFYIKNTTEAEDSLIRELEANDINCVAEFGGIADSLILLMNTSTLTPNLPLDCIISLKMFRIRSYSKIEPIEKGVEYLKALNIPVLGGLDRIPQTSPEQWRESKEGIPPSLIGASVAMPEIDGVIEPIVISGEIKDPVTAIYHKAPIDEQIDWIVNRTLSWINLRHKNNADKKIAIIYYHHSPGKADVGVWPEGGLDTHASLVNVLGALKERGYTLGNTTPNITELRDLMVFQGKNVGVWAQDELDNMVENGSVALIPEREYLDWFNELSEDKRGEVVERWGAPPGEIMVYENATGKYLVIPNVAFGNVLLAPQPMRGKGQNISVMFYDKAIVPHHQYIAFYLWLNKEFGADAVIHFGTYGSFEYLPGKQAGLDVTSCWPAILIQDMPHIYHYTIDGTAGATQAKRRSNAVIIDYLTPPIVAAGLYGNLSNLDNDILMYNQAADESVKNRYRESIIKQCRDLNLDKDLGVDLNATIGNTTAFDAFKEELHNYLYTLKTEYMPYGLHILGEPPSGDSLVSMIKSMLGYEFKEYVALTNLSENCTKQLIEEVIFNGTTPEDAQNKILGNVSDNLTAFLNLSIIYADNLNASTIEIPRTLDGLEGEFIPPGVGGDPIRKPDAVPSGRNLYSFDPREIPTKVAWEIGKEMADQLLDQHLNKTNGTYPRKVAVFLWATETMKHLGVMESEILYLMGVRPVWDKWGRPTKVELIPASELGRPRIDVVIVPSGVYRDHFPEKLTLIDKAVRLAAQANDTQMYPNYINESSEAIYEWLIDNGYDESIARDLSMARIFSASPGSYGPSIAGPVHESHVWADDSTLGDHFISGWGYVYGEDRWGEQVQDVFRQNLDGVEIVTHSVSSNNYGILYGDSYFADLGGLALAVRTVTGETPDIYINNLRDPNTPKIETLSQFLARELRTRNLNPHWIEGMMEHDYYGASIISSGFENLWGWDVMTPDVVTDYMWNEMYDVYVQDKYNLGLESWFNENNPYALQSMTARMLEAIRKEYWNPSDDVKRALAETYQKSVEDYGVTCCGHTCANPFLDETLSGILSVPGAEPPKQSSSSGGGTYPPDVMTTPKPPAPESTTNETQAEDISAIPGGVKDIPVVEEPEEVVGQVIEKTEMKTDITFSGMEVLGLVAVLLVLGLIYAGFRYRKR